MKPKTKLPPKIFTGAWLDKRDNAMLVDAAKRNGRSLAGEVRVRLLGTTTAHPIGDTQPDSTFKK